MRVPGWFPIKPGELYYGPLLKELRAVTGSGGLITLRGAGFVDPVVRHQHGDRIVTHKHQKHQAVLRLGSGHSQGGNEMFEDALDHPEEVEAVLLFAAPIGGVDTHVPIPIPGINGMRRGSPAIENLRAKQRKVIEQYRQEKIARVPQVYIISSSDDLLVSCESAHDIDPEYPDVHHFCLTSNSRHQCHPDSVMVPASRLDGNHLTALRRRPALALARQILTDIVARLADAQAA